MVAACANPPPRPAATGAGVADGCANAVRLKPSAALIASWNCCSLILRTLRASGSLALAEITSRVSLRPSASDGTAVDGSLSVKLLAAAVTALSMAASAAAAAAGVCLPSCLNSPAYVVSMPSKNESSFGGAVTRDAVRVYNRITRTRRRCEASTVLRSLKAQAQARDVRV